MSQSEFVDEEEAIWIDSKDFLEDHGYTIHPRYDLSFRPKSKLEQQEARYGQLPVSRSLNSIFFSYRGPQRACLVEAVRKSDCAQVILKALDTDSPELQIGMFFSDPSRVSHPRNHCVPIYDSLDPPAHPNKKIIVMPLLRRFMDPLFDTVGEGIQYMHEHRIAHRDISDHNIMMDSREMYPRGFHAGLPSRTRDFSRSVAPAATRTQIWPRYYLIDFGHSRTYRATEIPCEEKIGGADHSVPEHRTAGFGCNPFPTDIYCLGNILRRHFLNNVSVAVDSLRTLVLDMVKERPSERPTVDEVALRYYELTQCMSQRHLRSPVQGTGDAHLFSRIRSLSRRITFILTQRSPLPMTGIPAATLPSCRGGFYTQERHGGR
ncbi:hypothetical protein B0H15DRAFT_773532 [Mycena belliarum]|uniref:Protein kinase domain-containing protein n=1 Tax=Mycena belliarum TaxID=1033014 RepID=A0AAD6XQX2_9AGAR|nr:hypothetical protein B0H15DRAFT_773532 [Mycena belliae]